MSVIWLTRDGRVRIHWGMLADPTTLAPQDNTTEAAAERRAVKLWLVVSDDTPERRFAVDADQAWTYFNDAYDHCSGAFETPGPNTSCRYELRES